MSNIFDKKVEIPRRTMVLFFLIDTSGSMLGEKIGQVYNAIREILPEIEDISVNNADAEIKLAALTFETDCKWITDRPVSPSEFIWKDLTASGNTSLGKACLELDKKLSRNAFMNDSTGSYAPAIFLLSDGEPTDNYSAGIKTLKNNNWFKAAIKVAIAIGNNANQQTLADFTGSTESVITVHSPEALKKWIKFVSVRVSQIGSKSSNVNNDSISKQTELEKEIEEEQNQEEQEDTLIW